MFSLNNEKLVSIVLPNRYIAEEFCAMIYNYNSEYPAEYEMKYPGSYRISNEVNEFMKRLDSGLENERPLKFIRKVLVREKSDKLLVDRMIQTLQNRVAAGDLVRRVGYVEWDTLTFDEKTEVIEINNNSCYRGNPRVIQFFDEHPPRVILIYEDGSDKPIGRVWWYQGCGLLLNPYDFGNRCGSRYIDVMLSKYLDTTLVDFSCSRFGYISDSNSEIYINGDSLVTIEAEQTNDDADYEWLTGELTFCSRCGSLILGEEEFYIGDEAHCGDCVWYCSACMEYHTVDVPSYEITRGIGPYFSTVNTCKNPEDNDDRA